MEKELELGIGSRYGKLVVIERINGKEIWKCQCDCGKTAIIRSSNLKRGRKSCGCIIRNIDLRLNDNLTAIRADYAMYRCGAERKKRNFELSVNEFKNLIIQDCFYCGGKPNTQYKLNYKHDFFRNGIDRMDNNKGYTLENCVPCCYKCNRGKRSFEFDEWKEWVGVIYHKLFPITNNAI